MAITPEAFKAWLGVAFAQWPREASKLNNPLIQRVWKTATDQLTDEEWYQAIEIAIARCEFMPPVEKLIEFVKPSKEAVAIQDWATINQIVPLSIPEARERLLQLSPQTRTALQAIGGFGAVKCADQRDLPKLEKQFIAAHSQPINILALPQAAVLDTKEIIVDIAYDWDHVEKACQGNKEYHLSQLSEKGRLCLDVVGEDKLTMSVLTSGELWKAFQSQYHKTPGSSKRVVKEDTPLSEERRIEVMAALKKIGAVGHE
jgi:hypothetical protein